VAEIQEYLGVDTLAYLELDRLVDATGAVGAGFCDACLTGEYPVTIPENLTKGLLETGGEVSETRVAAPRLLDDDDRRLPADLFREE
jgi:amidophosphoribosyltransferase